VTAEKLFILTLENDLIILPMQLMTSFQLGGVYDIFCSLIHEITMCIWALLL